MGHLLINGRIFIRHAWICHCVRFKTYLVLSDLDLIFMVKVLYTVYLLNRWMDIFQTCMDMSMK